MITLPTLTAHSNNLRATSLRPRLQSGAKINMPDPEVMRLNADAMNTGDMSAGLHEWAALKRMAARRRQS